MCRLVFYQLILSQKLELNLLCRLN